MNDDDDCLYLEHHFQQVLVFDDDGDHSFIHPFVQTTETTNYHYPIEIDFI